MAAHRANHFNQSTVRSLASLAGVSTTALGIDLAEKPCRAQLATEAMRALVDKTAEDKACSVMYDVDYVRRTDACAVPAEAPSPMLKSLRAKGWAQVDDWGLDLRSLANQSRHLLRPFRSSNSSPAVISLPNVMAPALAPLLERASLSKLLSEYLGGRVRYEGHVLLHVSQRVTTQNYISSLWHHDRCGRRIKLFIFLHDVVEGGRPTLVADGSHRTNYFMLQGGAASSRIAADYVKGRYRISPMLGQAGGGFLFDTNTLHRGMHEGNLTRTTLVLEFHKHDKIARLKAIPSFREAPCPSVKGAGMTGLSGYPLFPSEVDRGGGRDTLTHSQ